MEKKENKMFQDSADHGYVLSEEGVDEGINAEWIRTVELSKKEKISVKEAEKLFLTEKYGEDYGEKGE